METTKIIDLLKQVQETKDVPFDVKLKCEKLVNDLIEEEKEKKFTGSRKQGLKKVRKYCMKVAKKNRPTLGYYDNQEYCGETKKVCTDSYFACGLNDSLLELNDNNVSRYPSLNHVLPDYTRLKQHGFCIENFIDLREVKAKCKDKKDGFPNHSLVFSRSDEEAEVYLNYDYLLMALETLEYSEKNYKNFSIMTLITDKPKPILIMNEETKEWFIILPCRKNW